MKKDQIIEKYLDVVKFNYKLQEGITLKMNAAFLMKQIGIV
ncbi:MAG TPA: hypothetical protein VMV77_16990 [Bacteroidales bacterium]|nr:hypothetical protein [Bacteroidales bacterium]